MRPPLPPTTRSLAAGPCSGATVLVAFAAVTLSACAAPGGGGGSGAGDSSTSSAAGAAAHDLVVEVDLGDGSPAERYTLTCGSVVEGDHPDAAAACEHLAGLQDPFVPIPADAICTEQYGGPQTAQVTGVWDGEPVDLALSRVDGCAISQWDALGPLLPGPGGGAPPG